METCCWDPVLATCASQPWVIPAGCRPGGLKPGGGERGQLLSYHFGLCVMLGKAWVLPGLAEAASCLSPPGQCVLGVQGADTHGPRDQLILPLCCAPEPLSMWFQLCLECSPLPPRLPSPASSPFIPAHVWVLLLQEVLRPPCSSHSITSCTLL